MPLHRARAAVHHQQRLQRPLASPGHVRRRVLRRREELTLRERHSAEHHNCRPPFQVRYRHRVSRQLRSLGFVYLFLRYCSVGTIPPGLVGIYQDGHITVATREEHPNPSQQKIVSEQMISPVESAQQQSAVRLNIANLQFLNLQFGV